MSGCFSESKLFEGQEASTIANCLDTEIFKPIEKELARKILNLPINKKIILYGAIGGTKNPNKGYIKLEQAKEYLFKEGQKDLLFLVFGNDYKRVERNDEVETHYLGHLSDDFTLALVYSAADVMVLPSLQDNLPNTAVEAIACGTPVVAFNTGGLPDIVDHNENVYLAEPYSSNDLARGIEWVLADENRNKWLSKQARKKAEEQFDIEKVAKRYIELYKKVVAKS